MSQCQSGHKLILTRQTCFQPELKFLWGCFTLHVSLNWNFFGPGMSQINQSGLKWGSAVMVFQNSGKRSICCKREKRDIVDIVFHALRLSRHIALSRVNFPYIWKVVEVAQYRSTKLCCCLTSYLPGNGHLAQKPMWKALGCSVKYNPTGDGAFQHCYW